MTQIVAKIDKYCQYDVKECKAVLFKYSVINNLYSGKSGTDIAIDNNANGTK
jgi:hypothetical protein